ncbi:hypothetical protein [Allocoleopsis franciscana]|uniref:Uncharacterized protein n=1 Tax=Allocoleopsis franciscana PCC 7113 TaxID=1173027 RepID=K9WQY1_9CYAN|nr:hypothetical protein [Allocoleopsis franciscana]AFZ21977.1 hypothetical protein Mic7113_6395 [Allocoleopsis franciscana PCC 7113]
MFLHKFSRRLYWAVTGFLLSIFLFGLPLTIDGFTGLKAVASTQPPSPIPTTTWQNTPLPDWNQITFSNLPAIAESGSLTVPNDVVNQLGYDPSRNWSAGQKPADFLMLGDFQDGFKLQDFSLSTINHASSTGLNLNRTSLQEFGVMAYQTLGSLVKAIPTLSHLPIEEVKPILDLLQSQLTTDVNPAQTIGQLLAQSPLLGDLEFSKLPLDKYDLASIPGLDTTSIGSFSDWQIVNIDQIPGLSDVPFSQFPTPANPVGTDVGTVDIAFGSAEQQRERTISGSDVEGFTVPCEQDCAHAELAGSAKILGRQWISGKSQDVRGGHGILAAVNNGLEPTGRLPFGDAFKVVIWDISEPKGTVDTALFFRFCMRKGFVDLGCTPYFIGPIPWLSYHEKDAIFLGNVDAIAPSTNLSQSTQTSASAEGVPNAINPHLPSANSSKPGNCGPTHQGVSLGAYASAISEIEGGYGSIGSFVEDSAGNRGRALGRYQLMSYRNDVREKILSKPGGKQFLAKVDAGKAVSSDEMLSYFSQADQNALFDADASALLDRASEQIDPTTGQPFTGSRLIERAAQMHFGGPAAATDGGVSDAFGRFTLYTYGKEAAANYQSTFNSLGCS